MSQNLSKVSDIYMPELIELDSYWEKAVEDATYDTLKSEKRLYQALKNREKINQKLEKFGILTVCSRLNSSGRRQPKVRSGEDIFRRKSSGSEWESDRDNSAISLLTMLDEEDDFSKDGKDLERKSTSVIEIKSKGHRETPPEKKYRFPERPYLGNGSMEKMKKSQNSFNCEPMGVRDSLGSEDGKKEACSEMDGEVIILDEETSTAGKNVEWLHVRPEDTFKDSDTDVSARATPKQADKTDSGFQKSASVKDKNYFLDPSIKFSMNESDNSQLESRNYNGMELDLDDYHWDKEDEDGEKEDMGELDERLCLALAKRDIVSENLKALKMEDSSSGLEIDESQVEQAAKFRKNAKHLSPFVQFYLEVFRELCHKIPVKMIMREAAERWRNVPRYQDES